MGWLGDFLGGTQGAAAKKNEANVNAALGYLQGVPVEQLFGLARGALGDQTGRQDYQQAIGLLGQAGTGSQLEALQRAREAQAGNRQQLAQRGLYNSSLATGADAGINAATDRTLAGIAGQTAGAQAGVKAAQGAQEFNRQSGIAGLYAGQVQAQLRQAGGLADTQTSVQYQGSPGVLGSLLGSAGAGITGALGVGSPGEEGYQAGSSLAGAGAALAGCCFIAVAAAGMPLDPAVREYRDAKASPRKRRGYYRLAEWLVPRMRRPRVHALVRGLMVEPLTRYARWRMRGEGMGWVCWPAAVFWLSAFSVLGLGKPMLRSNGETV